MLTPKERLYNVMKGNAVDRPPCICPGGMMNMVTTDLMDAVDIYMPQAHTDARMMAGLAKAVYDYGCFENYGVPFCMTVEAEEMGAKVEMGSRVYEPHVSAYAIESVEDYAKLPPIDIGRGRAKVVLDAIRILREETDGVPIIGNLTGPISTASSVMEPVVFYKELRKKISRPCIYGLYYPPADRVWKGADRGRGRCDSHLRPKRHRRDPGS